MFHLAAFYQSVDPAGALTQINAVADQAIRTSGKDLVVPSQLPYLLGEAALSAATGPGYGQVQSPSLRQLANQDVSKIISAVTWTQGQTPQFHGMNPRALRANESMNFAVEATGGVAAANYGLVWIGDGAVAREAGNMFTVRGTLAASLTAGTWENSAITFDDTLPAGTYKVMGMRVVSTNGVAARLVLVGQAYRPGVICAPTEEASDFEAFRGGQIGSFGTFDVNQPPTVDVLGATDTSQTIYLDLVKVS